MEPMTTTLVNVAKGFRGPQETDADIVNDILGRAARLASDLFMPDLGPIMDAVYAYARATPNVKKAEAAIDTMKQLNGLAIHIARYGDLLGILEWAEGRHIAQAKEDTGKEAEA